jgi:DNA polymerase sigma
MVLQTVHPGARTHVFGSSITGLRLPYGDVDLMVEAPDMDADRMLPRLARALRDASVPTSMLTLPHARVPIIKWTDRETNIKVDACINHPSGLATSALLARSAATLPELRPLVLVLKSQLLMHGLHETRTGGVGGYLLANMVRHMLISHEGDGSPPQEDLGGLLLRFYWYYGFRLNTASSIVMRAEDRTNVAHRPGRAGYLAHAPHMLSINDPAMPESDIGAKAFRFMTVRRLLRSSFAQLSKRIHRRREEQRRQSAASENEYEDRDEEGAGARGGEPTGKRAASQQRSLLSAILPNWEVHYSGRGARRTQKELIKISRRRRREETQFERMDEQLERQQRHLDARLAVGDLGANSARDPLWGIAPESAERS